MLQYGCQLEGEEGWCLVNVAGGVEAAAACYVSDFFFDNGIYQVVVENTAKEKFRVVVGIDFGPHIQTSRAIVYENSKAQIQALEEQNALLAAAVTRGQPCKHPCNIGTPEGWKCTMCGHVKMERLYPPNMNFEGQH